jgi:hypothetical protein
MLPENAAPPRSIGIGIGPRDRRHKTRENEEYAGQDFF